VRPATNRKPLLTLGHAAGTVPVLRDPPGAPAAARPKAPDSLPRLTAWPSPSPCLVVTHQPSTFRVLGRHSHSGRHRSQVSE
jgi:hypothetical protein